MGTLGGLHGTLLAVNGGMTTFFCPPNGGRPHSTALPMGRLHRRTRDWHDARREGRDERDGVIGVMGCWRVRDGRVVITPVVLRDRVGRDVIDPCLEFPCRVLFSVFVIRFFRAVPLCSCRAGVSVPCWGRSC